MRETDGELLKGFEDNDNENIMGQKKTKRKFLLISIISIIVVLTIIFLIIFITKKTDSEQNDDNDPTEIDTIPKEEFEKARNSFKQFNFTDPVNSSKILFYNFFIPENYNKTQNIKYPLIMFIGDASTVGKETTYPLSQTVGGPIWATDTIQKKHKCFVLVPQFNEIIIDDNNGYTKSEYINVTTRLI
jgi:predicted peptidase